MKKPRAVGLIAALGLLLGGCGAKTLALEPEKLQQADGSFGLSEVSLGATVEETEKALGVSLKEPVRESSGIASYEIDGPYYALDGEKLHTELEFGSAGLQMAAFYPEADEAAYEALLKQLTEAYGEPDQTIDNSGEALGGTISTRGAQWVVDDTRLQLMWMNGEKIEPGFSLIVGYGK